MQYQKEINCKNKSIENLVHEDIQNETSARDEEVKSPELSFGSCGTMEGEVEQRNQKKHDVEDPAVKDKSPIVSDMDLSRIEFKISPIVSMIILLEVNYRKIT